MGGLLRDLAARHAQSERFASLAARKRAAEEEAFARRADEVVADIKRRMATCHERVACPYCLARAGERCRSMKQPGRTPPVLTKHPHVERTRADGIYER